MSALLIILACLLFNALMSCAEMAFVTVDKKSIRNKSLGGDAQAIVIEKMHKVPERLLSAIQIGITLVGAISAAVGGAGAEEKIAPMLASTFLISEGMSETIAIILVVLPLTFFSVVIGELVPKTLGMKFSLPIILKMATPLQLTEKLLYPLIIPLEKITKLILKILLRNKTHSDHVAPEEDISLKGLRIEHKQYVKNLIDLESKIVKNILVPWDKVNHISYFSEASEVLEKILKTTHTRLPVVADHEVCGFLHVKEFLKLFKSNKGNNWVSFLRPPRFITPETKLLDALKMMQKSRVHILIVGSENNPLGIVTLEDVLEEVIGDIIDEDEDNKLTYYLKYNLRTPKIRT